ncbi:putative transcription factor WD40-like family [Helianthus annuus]|nr:putative transcription factor WD40-like family [Helianthus annuus]
MQLIYTNSGSGLLVLASSGIHKLWKWQQKSTASIVPRLWHPVNGAVMFNDVNESKPTEESASCIALSKNDAYVLSASGGKVSLFNMMTFKTKIRLKGHQKQITGLAFSQALNSLASCGADAQGKLKSRSLQSPPGYTSSLVGDTKVQYHKYQLNLLVVHESHIAIYDPDLVCLKLWSPREPLSAPISSATYSSDGLLIFTGFSDGALGVFDAESLSLRFHVSPSAYISPSVSSSNNTAYPLVIAAHPYDCNQFALGMSDGSVHVIELGDADPKSGSSAPQEIGTLASSNASNLSLNSQQLETVQTMVQNMRI